MFTETQVDEALALAERDARKAVAYLEVVWVLPNGEREFVLCNVYNERLRRGRAIRERHLDLRWTRQLQGTPERYSLLTQGEVPWLSSRDRERHARRVALALKLGARPTRMEIAGLRMKVLAGGAVEPARSKAALRVL